MHFIRCILPNSSKQHEEFEEELVLRQLRTSCTVSYAKFIRFGYSERIDFQEFADKFKILEDKFKIDRDGRTNFYSKILISIGFSREEFKMGTETIFLRLNKLEVLKKIFSDMATIPNLIEEDGEGKVKRKPK